MTTQAWPLTTRPFSEADLEFGLRLTEQAGWNQTPDDWRRAWELAPDGAFVAQIDGRDAGVVTTCVHGPVPRGESPQGAVAWIALLLVEANLRNRGAGRLLLDTALDWLDRRSIPTVRLDATPLGQPLYEQRGFVADFSLIRFAGRVASIAEWVESRASSHVNEATNPSRIDVGLSHLSEASLGEARAIDQTVVGADRTELLERLSSLAPDAGRIARQAGRAVGFALARPGRVATQIGPCLALAPDAGEALLRDAFARNVGRLVYVDVPADNEAACHWARAVGLAEQRRLLRMTRGPRRTESLAALWASVGPEKG